MSVDDRDPDVLEDDALMVRVQADEPGAFQLIYERHAPAALRAAQGVSARRAQDALQDGFISVWRHRADYRPGAGSVRAWIVTIVRRRALDLARMENRRPARHDDEGLAGLSAPGGSMEDETIARDDGELLRGALQRLTGIQREVIVLAYFGGLTHRQIAERLGLPEGTVKGRMRLGLEKLRDDSDAIQPQAQHSAPPVY